MGEWMYSSKQS